MDWAEHMIVSMPWRPLIRCNVLSPAVSTRTSPRLHALAAFDSLQRGWQGFEWEYLRRLNALSAFDSLQLGPGARRRPRGRRLNALAAFDSLQRAGEVELDPSWGESPCLGGL